MYTDNLTIGTGKGFPLASVNYVTWHQPLGTYTQGLFITEISNYTNLLCMDTYTTSTIRRMRFEFIDADHSRELISYNNIFAGYLVNSNSKPFVSANQINSENFKLDHSTINYGTKYEYLRIFREQVQFLYKTET